MTWLVKILKCQIYDFVDFYILFRVLAERDGGFANLFCLTVAGVAMGLAVAGFGMKRMMKVKTAE